MICTNNLNLCSEIYDSQSNNHAEQITFDEELLSLLIDYVMIGRLTDKKLYNNI